MSTPEEYRLRMQRVKEVFERRRAQATRAKGLVIVFTGAGKGKSTAAFGMVVRALHHGMRVGVVQYIKGPIPSGEVEVFGRFGDQVQWYRMGEGFHWDTQDQERDRRAAWAAWAKSCELMADPRIDMVVLDEINVALRLRQLPVEEVLRALEAKREMLHVILTGRGAPADLVAAADLVTEMRMLKHPYRAGIRAQPGIEY